MRLRTLAMLRTLALTACASSSDTTVCDKLSTGLNDFATKAAQCVSTPPSTGITAEQCRQSIDKCTDSDRQKLADFGSCLSALPTCTPSTLSAWQSSVQSCLLKLAGISSGC